MLICVPYMIRYAWGSPRTSGVPNLASLASNARILGIVHALEDAMMLDIGLLGDPPSNGNPDPRLAAALDWMARADGDRDLAIVWARKALQIEPACVPALLVLAEYAATRTERVALLKEAVSIHQRAVAEDPDSEITSCWDPGAGHLMVALSRLGDALLELGDRQGARACYRHLTRLDDESGLGMQDLDSETVRRTKLLLLRAEYAVRRLDREARAEGDVPAEAMFGAPRPM